jgi:hypothetical protein
MTLPLVIHRFNGPRGGDEIQYLTFGAARAAPRPDVVFARHLRTVLELADLREVPLAHSSQSSPSQVRFNANLSEARS